MSIALRGLEPEVRERAQLALDWANRFGINIIVTSGYRTFLEQEQLYRRFLAGNSRFPANPPGDSAHNHRLAWDSVLPRPFRGIPAFERWWIAVREAAGFFVPPNDHPHAAVPGWRRFVS